MSEKKTHPGGRPKESVEEKVDLIQVERLAELGMTDEQIGYILQVSPRTIDNYKKDPKFIALLKRGKAVADSQVVKSLYKRAIGFEFDEETHEAIMVEGKPTNAIHTKTVKKLIIPDTTAQIFWLKNRMPEQWRDKQHIDHTTKGDKVETTVFYLPDNGRDKKK